MELRVLRYVVAVADAGTMTAAAHEMRIAQPSLSRQIKAFERSVGFDIFERNTQGISLTPAGTELVARIRSLVAHAAQIEDTAKQLADGISARLSMQATTTIAHDIVSPFIAGELRGTDPHIDVVAVPSDDRHSGLDLDADLTLATYPPPQRFSSRRLGFIPMYAQVHPGHQLRHHSSIAINELLSENLLVATKARRTVAMVKRSMHEYGAGLHGLTECPVPRVAQALAAAARGVVITSDAPRFGLVAIPLTRPPSTDSTIHGPVGVDAWIAWRSDHVATTQIAGLARRLAHFYRGQGQPIHTS